MLRMSAQYNWTNGENSAMKSAKLIRTDSLCIFIRIFSVNRKPLLGSNKIDNCI